MLVSQSLLEHYHKGTKYAVEKLLNSLSGGGEVIEWFQPEYDGTAKPYFFKVKLKKLRDLEDDGTRLMRAINSAKNLRSWLEIADFDLGTDHHEMFFGVITDLLGKILHELNTRFIDNHKLWLIHSQIFSGNICHELDFANVNHFANPRAGFFILQSGNISFGADFTESEETFELYLQWLKYTWRQNRKNAVVRFYSDSPDPVIDDPDEPTEFEMQGNFLKLWLSFYRSDSSRLLVIPFPREDVTAEDINAVNVENLFLDRHNNPSEKIIRSVLVNKKVTKIFL